MPYIGNQPGTGVRSRFIYTATASQTTFSGADDNSKTLKYADSDYIDVYLNGVCLVPGTDYTASTKTSVVLTQAASVSDTLEVVAYDIATISDTVSKADGGTFEDGVTIRTADNTTQLTLESTDADANSGPVLELYRNSSSPADDDVLGEIEFHGENDADEKIQYGLIAAKLQDASDGTEDVRLSFKTITAGTERERITIQPTEVVINEDSQDLDFRVEGNSAASMFHVDALNDRIGVGVNDPDAILDISGVSAGGNVLGILRVTQRASGAAAYGLDVGLDPTHGDPVFSTIVNDTLTEAIRIDRANATTHLGTTLSFGGKLNLHEGGVGVGEAEGAGYYRRMYWNASNNEMRFWNGSNEARITDGGVFTNASDISLKKDIADIEYGIDTVKSLQPRKYKMKSDDKEQVGFIAQEMESHVPEIVSVGVTPDGDEHKGISYGQLTAVLTKALQEAIAKIETLETKVAALEAE